MKKIFSFTKKKKHSSGTPDNGSVLSVGYELKDKDLGKVHKAASVGDLAKLKQLAKKNDINQLDKENRTALHIACASGHVEVVQFLVESKAKLNLCDNQNRSALMKAVQSQHERCISILLENHAEPNLVDINGNTALHLTANIPSISTAVLLLEHDADINTQNKEGFAPLTVAVREDHIEMAEFLLKESADVNVIDQAQRSPLMIAAGNGQIGMLRLLLRFEADISLKDTKGWSADDYAVMNGHHPCSLLIIEHSTQRNDGPSLSLQGPSKRKKKTLLGSPSQDVEAGFSLGGPATDKDDFEDISQSESLSRVSKSAADEWLSSDDDDESVLIEKKPQKVNLRKLIASERGQADIVAEREKSKHSEQPSSSKARSNPQEGSPEPEESEEEDGEEEEEEEEEEEDDEDEEEEEEEEEEEDDDDDDDEESEEDGEEEDEEENECEEEEDENNVATVEAKTTEFEDQQKPSVASALEILDGSDPQNVPGSGIVGETEKDSTTENLKNESPAVTQSFAIPATLNVAEDCVVSAIRVEAKFSDEDDSLGKDFVKSSAHHINSDMGLSRGPIKEEDCEKEDNDSWIDEHNSGETVWNDSDDEEENQKGGFGRNTVLANRMRPLPADQEENTDGSTDAGSNKEASKKDKRRSSWGSSLEDSDDELPKEEEVQEAMLDQKSDVQPSDLQPEPSTPYPNEDPANTSQDISAVVRSPKCASPRAVDKPTYSLKISPTSTPKPENRPAKTTADESDWDSTSENNNRHDNGCISKGDVLALDAETNIVTENQTGEQPCFDDCREDEEKESIDKESNDPSPAVSPAPEDEVLDNDDVEPVSQLSQTEGEVDSENEKDDDDSWDDEDEGSESEKQTMVKNEVAECGNILKTCPATPSKVVSPKSRPSSVISTKLGEEAELDDPEDDEGNGETSGDEREQQQLVVKEDNASKDDEPSEDSDSMDKKLQYDFASATVKVSDDRCVFKGDKSDDENGATLIAFVPLETAIVPLEGLSSDDLHKEPIREKISSCPPTKEDAIDGQRHDSDRSTLSDEELPQTDIDDVDLDSPDVESVGATSQELRNVEEHAIQDKEYTEDDDEKEQDEVMRDDEEEEEDISEENDHPEESRGSLVASLPVPESEGSKNKERDFLSELGLEKGEEEQDTWDSESHSESPKMPQKEKQSLRSQDQEKMAAVKEEIKKVTNDESDDSGEEQEEVDQGFAQQKETEKAKWEPLSVLSKLQGEKEQTDLMEELGLGDVDDLEDASDWDSASTTSKRTLPGRRMASPGIEELPECSSPPFKEEDEDVALEAPITPERSINSNDRLPGTPPQPVPHPQPRARKMVLQKPESEEESDWEPENLATSCNTTKVDNQQENIAELQVMDTPGSPELSPRVGERRRNAESDKRQKKEKDDSVDTSLLDLDSPIASGYTGSDSGEKDNDFRYQCRTEERGKDSDDPPWEKRYEKLWVEVEKRDVKSNFKNVACELKEKFGELLKSSCPAEEITEDEEEMAESSSSDEEEEEEEGEIIVRPTARARSTVLLTIPEQRESGLEDSATESTEGSAYEDRMQVYERPTRESSLYQQNLLVDDAQEECRSLSPQLTRAHRDSTENTTTTFTDGHNRPTSNAGQRAFLQDEAKLVQNTHLNNTCKDTNAYEAAKKTTSPGEDPEEFPEYRNPSLCRRSASVPGVSDDELEEDMERFKLEVGMLKVVFLDMEKDKARLQNEVVQDTAKTAMDVHKSSTSWDTGGAALEEEVSSEKPESSLASQSSQAGAIPQEQQHEAMSSTNEAPVQLHLPLQQTHSSNKQEGEAIEGTSQLELVRGARHSRAPQTNTHVNGDALSVFDDSTLSELSDDEGRLPTSGQKNENPGEVDMAEDFDELTQSSDTATDDIDSPTSGYRHASLLVQKLDSATFDSRSLVKLQNIFHEYERSIQKARSRHGYLTDKVSQLEMERTDLKSSLEEVKDIKSALERNQLELQTEVTNIKFQLKQEQENRRNATMMYNTTKDKLRRTEEQHEFEVQERQKLELTLRNLELEMRTLVNNMKQLEEDHSETQRLLAQERSARTLQENLLNSHLRKQQEIEDENKRNISKSNEALSQLTEASDRERELLQQTSTLQEQLTILRTDFQHSQANSSLKESHLLEENDTLKEQIEDARRDLKLSNEALTQTVFNCNNQITTLKSELAMTATRFENERKTRETLETEVESVRSRLAGAVKEAELCLAAHTDTERALLREKEEHQRLKDRLTGEAATQREAVSSLSQKLTKAEARANSMENEVHRVTLQLTEKGLLLEVLQREKDQAAVRAKELESTLHAERELVSRAAAREEAAKEQLAQAKSEEMLLRQQLSESQNKGEAKERAVTDAQQSFKDILSKLRSDYEERAQLVEERNKELASKAADLRDQIYKLEEEKSEREANLRQLQQELADSLKKLSMSEASLEVNTRYRSDLEDEKARLLKDLDRLKGKLEESEDQYVQAERRINSLKSSLDEKEKDLITAAQKLQEALSTSAASESTIKQLEDAVQRLEIENARLEAAAKQQSNKIDALQKGAQEAVLVRNHLEDLVTNLQSSKMTLEDQLSREVQKQSVLSHTAQDSKALWEEELKSRSRLGLRLAELEKEKGDLSTQMEIEKKKAKKVAEQKKAIDERLDQEMKRNTDLQKEMYRLRTLVKSAKKRLRDQESGGAEFGSPMSSLRIDQGRHSQAEGSFGRMKEKVEDLQVQLEKEASRRSQLERMNGELKDQLASMRGLSHSNDQQERGKRQLEDEVLDLRRRMEAAQMEQSQVEQFRRDAEERARQEIQQKLEQVNLFLQSQAASQDALDQIKSANEANLRSQLEHKIRELEGDLGRARTTHHDSLNQRDSTRTELERYRQLYAEELRLRKSLAAKLERANTRLSEANSKLLNERSRSLITSSIANGSLAGPSLDVGSLGSPAHYGNTLGPLNRSFGLGLSLLSPVTDGQNSRVEDYLAKMQSELDKNISKELNNATAELYVTSARMSTAGSSSRAELDPVSTAAEQYLEVLKKNYMI